ncbi:hypothetical protein C8J56DRAFT_919941 [Mycena floridula]|nr:hypothetical protein C8J56DRAFT_919941 [Mycena floridula]
MCGRCVGYSFTPRRERFRPRDKMELLLVQFSSKSSHCPSSSLVSSFLLVLLSRTSNGQQFKTKAAERVKFSSSIVLFIPSFAVGTMRIARRPSGSGLTVSCRAKPYQGRRGSTRTCRPEPQTDEEKKLTRNLLAICQKQCSDVSTHDLLKTTVREAHGIQFLLRPFNHIPSSLHVWTRRGQGTTDRFVEF